MEKTNAEKVKLGGEECGGHGTRRGKMRWMNGGVCRNARCNDDDDEMKEDADAAERVWMMDDSGTGMGWKVDGWMQ